MKKTAVYHNVWTAHFNIIYVNDDIKCSTTSTSVLAAKVSFYL